VFGSMKLVMTVITTAGANSMTFIAYLNADDGLQSRGASALLRPEGPTITPIIYGAVIVNQIF
jgi:hypothetical protein